MSEDARFERLPKWAQQEIRSLRAKAERTVEEVEKWYAERANENGGSSATAWLHPWDKNPQPITERERIRFTLDGIDGCEWFDVMVDRGELNIMASRGVLVSPRASNVVNLRVREW